MWLGLAGVDAPTSPLNSTPVRRFCKPARQDCRGGVFSASPTPPPQPKIFNASCECAGCPSSAKARRVAPTSENVLHRYFEGSARARSAARLTILFQLEAGRRRRSFVQRAHRAKMPCVLLSSELPEQTVRSRSPIGRPQAGQRFIQLGVIPGPISAPFSAPAFPP